MSNNQSDAPAPEPHQGEEEPSLLCDEEDLFDFPPLDVAFEGDDPFLDIDPFADPVSDGELEDMQGDVRPTLASDAAGEQHSDGAVDNHAETSNGPGEAVAAQPLTSANDNTESTDPAECPSGAEPTTGNPGSTRRPAAVHALIALALVMNLALVAVVWKTSFGLEQSLDGMRADLSHAAQERELQQALLLAQASRDNSSDETNTITSSRAKTETGATTDQAQLALHFARQELADGQWAFARQRLYRLLCELDQLGVDASLEAEARFLIAESYTSAAGVSPFTANAASTQAMEVR